MAGRTGFSQDCRASGYTPVLVVLDATNNPKLIELGRKFTEAAGECHLGDAAWKHLQDMAGEPMAMFLSRYVQYPIQALLKDSPQELPNIGFNLTDSFMNIEVGGELLKIRRVVEPELASDPDDIDGGVSSV